LAAEVPTWNDETFLNKAKVCIGGRITRLSWILKDKDSLEIV
jgi:hypothetical protein